MDDLRRHYDIVRVIWNDACFMQGQPIDPADPPHSGLIMVTVGWLLKSTKEGVTLAMEFNEAGGTRNATFVPRQIILKEDIILDKAVSFVEPQMEVKVNSSKKKKGKK